MDPGTLLTLAATGASLFGAYSQYEAGQEAEDLRKDQMREDLRRAQAEDRAKLADTRARIAASNLQMTGSPAKYASEMEKEQIRQRRWLARSGKAEAEALSAAGTSRAVGTLAKVPGYWV